MIRTGAVNTMFKIFNTESEWEIFQNVIHPNPLFKTKLYTHSKKEKDFFNTIINADWKDNTAIRPDFISNNIMIEMFEIDDIVSKKQGSNNPQRKADARALRTIKNIIDQIPEESISKNMNIIAHGDTRYSPELDKFTPTDSYSHHNYQAYLNNFNRICHKHMDKVEAYRKNYPLKKLGFLIIDDATFYIPTRKNNAISPQDAFYFYPIFDKNFMHIFIKSDVDFILWAFNNKSFYTLHDPYGQKTPFPNLFLITKSNYYTKHSRKFDISTMESMEE